MFENQRVSVILPTYNEKDSIRSVVERFFATGLPDEVIVVDNNSTPDTETPLAIRDCRPLLSRRRGLLEHNG